MNQILCCELLVLIVLAYLSSEDIVDEVSKGLSVSPRREINLWLASLDVLRLEVDIFIPKVLSQKSHIFSERSLSAFELLAFNAKQEPALYISLVILMRLSSHVLSANDELGYGLQRGQSLGLHLCYDPVVLVCLLDEFFGYG